MHNFSYGPINPLLGYTVSCLGSFLGLRCVVRASYRQGLGRARWLAIAATAIGAAGIWAMHFIAMLGFTITDQRITYNVPTTILSLVIVVAVVAVAVFIVGFGNGEPRRLVAGGLIIGLGVTAMHYLGMSAMIMPDSMSYNTPLFVLSVVIAIIAGTAALWIATWVRGIGATAGASVVMGAAISSTHYAGMAAMRVHPGGMAGMSSGASASSFLLPLVLGITLVTFVLAVMISLSPSQDELREDKEFLVRLGSLQQRGN